MATDQTRERLIEVLTSPLLAMGLDLEAVELTPAGRRRVLRVAVDKDGGVTLDDVAEATKEVSRLLDDPVTSGDVMGQHPYTLEVTSPGTDRPLTLPRHWRRNQGRLVKAKMEDGHTVRGRIVAQDDDGAVLDVAGDQTRLAYADVATARVEIELNRKES